MNFLFTDRDFYIKFIDNANTDSIVYRYKLNDAILSQKNLIRYIRKNIHSYEEIFNLNLNKYKVEWVERHFTTKYSLKNAVIKILKSTNDVDNKNMLVQLLKYCETLSQIHEYENLILASDKRKELTLAQYKDYIQTYYKTVLNQALQGFGYEFSNKIGTYIINAYRPKGGKTKDIQKTIDNYHKLKAQGDYVLTYSDKCWYDARKIPYEFVDYTVYNNADYEYKFEIIRTKLHYIRKVYVIPPIYSTTKNYKNMSIDEIAEKYCKTEEDIYNMVADPNFKIKLLLKLKPEVYKRYLNNETETKNKYRKNYRKDR